MLGIRRAMNGFWVLTAAFMLSAGQLAAQSTLKVVSASGVEGGDVTVKVALDTDQNVAGAEFKVNFDHSRLSLKEVAKGASSASFTMTDPTVFVVDNGDIGTDPGTLVIQMFDSTLANPIAAGSDREVLLLTFGIASGASGVIAVNLSEASLSNPSGVTVGVTAVSGEVTLGQATDVDLRVTDAQGPAGASVTVSVRADAVRDVHALSFSLVFDQSKVTLKSATRGASAPGSRDTLDVLSDLATANSTGKMDVYLVNFDLVFEPPSSKPLPAGNNREVYKFTFEIASSVADNTEIPMTLSGVEVAGIDNEEAVELTYTVHAGKVTVGGEPGDLDGNNKIDIFDLLFLLRVLGGTEPASALSDVNGDGKTDIFDLLALLRILAG